VTSPTFGQQDYSMRVWLDPEKLSAVNLTTTDVIKSLQEQNVQVAAGRIGQPPTEEVLDFEYTAEYAWPADDAEGVRRDHPQTGSEGQILRLRDVARIELGAKNQDQSCTLDGKPSTALAIFQLPGSNAPGDGQGDPGQNARAQKRLPPDVDYAIVYDTTPFIHESIIEVVKALRDAFILVAIVVLIFLQSWRRRSSRWSPCPSRLSEHSR